MGGSSIQEVELVLMAYAYIYSMEIYRLLYIVRDVNTPTYIVYI